MSSNTSGYIALSFVGGVMISLILVGGYYALGDSMGSPIGTVNYNNRLYGGTKTRRRNKNNNRKTKRT